MKKLTNLQRLFIVEYLKDLNATQACLRAGYKTKNPDQIGPGLLNQPEIAAEIQKAMDKRSARIELKADDVLRELLLIARTDLGQAYDENGNLKHISMMPEDVRRAISGIKVFEEFEGFGKERLKIGEVREVKFWDKLKALELIGKHLKLFTEKMELSGKVTLEDLIAGSNGSEK